MATLTRGKTFNSTEEVTNSKLHQLVDDATIAGIVNADIDASAGIVASKLDLSTVAQTIAMSSKAINTAKGSDIASATTCDIGAATGNAVDVTGTTTITSFGTVQSGTIRIVRFTGALILTHNATSLILPGGDNITTASGDVAVMISLGSGNWYCASFTRANGTPVVGVTAATALTGSVVNFASSTLSSTVNVNSAIPTDGSKPKSSEGVEVITCSVTPTNASNKLVIEFSTQSGAGTGNIGLVAALFQDSTADALVAAYENPSSTSGPIMRLRYIMTAGTTSAITFKIRMGASSGSHTVNYDFFGGQQTSLTITEYKV